MGPVITSTDSKPVFRLPVQPALRDMVRINKFSKTCAYSTTLYFNIQVQLFMQTQKTHRKYVQRCLTRDQSFVQYFFPSRHLAMLTQRIISRMTNSYYHSISRLYLRSQNNSAIYSDFKINISTITFAASIFTVQDDLRFSKNWHRL